MLKMIQDVERRIHDVMVVPPEMMKGVTERAALTNGLGIRVIESPLARMQRKRKKLKRAWDVIHGDHYVIVEVVDGYENVAFMFNSRALHDFVWSPGVGIKKGDFAAITNFVVP